MSPLATVILIGHRFKCDSFRMNYSKDPLPFRLLFTSFAGSIPKEFDPPPSGALIDSADDGGLFVNFSKDTERLLITAKGSPSIVLFQ